MPLDLWLTFVAASTALLLIPGPAVLLGLGALVLASATLFTALKWLGAAYLIWMGIKLLRAPRSDGLDTVATVQSSPRQVLTHAVAVTALNPKSIGFFLSPSCLSSSLLRPCWPIACAPRSGDLR